MPNTPKEPVTDVKSNAFTAPEEALVDAVPAPYPRAETPNMTPEERAAKKRFFVTQLERGVIHDRLHVDLPPHLHGEWVRRDNFEVEKMKALGFWVDTEYSAKRSLHGDGTKTGQVADVIFMCCSKEDKQLLDEVKHERFVATHAKRGSNTAKEENDYVKLMKQHGDIIPAVESKTRDLRAGDVAATIEAMNAQTP